VFKVESWTEEDWKKNLMERWERAKEYREKDGREETWLRNEIYAYTVLGIQPRAENIPPQEIKDADAERSEDEAVDDITVNYIHDYIRYNHALMSANPPDVLIRPMTQDEEDQRKARTADVVRRFARDKYNLQERSDERNLKTLTKGTGYLIIRHDASGGEMLDFDEETGIALMEGDFDIYSPSTFDIWLSPDAKSNDKMPWFFERIIMTKEEAKFKWPEHAELFEEQQETRRWGFFDRKKEEKKEVDGSIVEVLRYVEKALPWNGMLGRQAYIFADGFEILDKGENPQPNGQLGLHTLTDIDVEDDLYGKSIIDYMEPLQEMMAAIDTNDVANIAIGNVVRLLTTEGVAKAEEAVTTSQVDQIPIRGGNLEEVRWLQPPNTMPDSVRIRDQFRQGQKSLGRVNDAMTGQLTRETSGYVMDRAVESGQMPHRRLFNKYTRVTRDEYLNIFDIIIQEWTLPRMIKSFGYEREYDIREHFVGTDIQGGWDIDVDYGRAFSLDPELRRQQIERWLPILREIPDFDPRMLARELKLGFADNILNRAELAYNRQQEYFDEMIKRFDQLGQYAYIEPRELEDHEAMYTYCRYYYHTRAFRRLDSELQKVIEQHIRARRDMIAKNEAKAQQPAAAVAGAPGMPPMPPQGGPVPM
jgi:hypothetical protein